MPSVQVVPVGVGAADALFVDENGLSRQHDGVELEGRQGFKAVAVDVEIMDCVHGRWICQCGKGIAARQFLTLQRFKQVGLENRMSIR